MLLHVMSSWKPGWLQQTSRTHCGPASTRGPEEEEEPLYSGDQCQHLPPRLPACLPASLVGGSAEAGREGRPGGWVAGWGLFAGLWDCASLDWQAGVLISRTCCLLGTRDSHDAHWPDSQIDGGPGVPAPPAAVLILPCPRDVGWQAGRRGGGGAEWGRSAGLVSGGSSRHQPHTQGLMNGAARQPAPACPPPRHTLMALRHTGVQRKDTAGGQAMVAGSSSSWLCH